MTSMTHESSPDNPQATQFVPLEARPEDVELFSDQIVTVDECVNIDTLGYNAVMGTYCLHNLGVTIDALSVERDSVQNDDSKNPLRTADGLAASINHWSLRHDRIMDLHQSSLRDVRERIGSFEDSLSDDLTVYMDEHAPAFVQQQKGDRPWSYWLAQQGSDMSWRSWLSQRATDDQLLNVLQSNAHMVGEQQQNDEFKNTVLDRKNDVKQAIEQLVTDGILAQSAVQSLDRIDKTEVRVGDMFSTDLAGRYGYHTFGTQYVVVQQGTGATPASRVDNLNKRVNRTLQHELIHAAVSQNQQHPKEHVMRSRWIEEALATRLDIKIERLNGEEPEEAKVKGSYRAERQALLSLSEAADGSQTDPDAMLTCALRAYSGGEIEFNEFKQAVDQASGQHGRLAQVDAEMRALDRQNNKIEHC